MHAGNYCLHQGQVYLQVLNNCKFHVSILPLRIWVPLTQRHFLSIVMLNLHRPQSRIGKYLLKIKEDRVRAMVVVPLWKSALGGFVVSERCNFGWWHLFKRWGYTLVKPHWPQLSLSSRPNDISVTSNCKICKKLEQSFRTSIYVKMTLNVV